MFRLDPSFAQSSTMATRRFRESRDSDSMTCVVNRKPHRFGALFWQKVFENWKLFFSTSSPAFLGRMGCRSSRDADAESDG
jgi:hypothetical protein